MRRILDSLCVLCLCISVALAGLWYHSRGQGGAVYAMGGGMALATYSAPGEMSLWVGRVDSRCRVSPVFESRERKESVSATAWFRQDKAARAVTRGRLGFGSCSNFPDFIPARYLRGRVAGLAAPFWLLVAATGAVPLARGVILLRRRVRTRAWRRQGRCDRCGYDLRASGGRCPECGQEPAPAILPAPRRPLRRRWLAPAAVAVVIGALVVFAGPSRSPAPAVERTASVESPRWWLDRAFEHARHLPPAGDRFKAYQSILRGYWVLEQPKAASRVLISIESDDTLREGSFRADRVGAELARGYARLGDDERFWRYALPAERKMQDDPWSDWLARPLATAYAWRGDFASVAAVTTRITNIGDRIPALTAPAEDPAAPDLRRVRASIVALLKTQSEQATTPGDQSFLLFSAAKLQIAEADFAGASQTIAAIPRPGYQANAWDMLAKAYEAAGDGAAGQAARRRAQSVRPPPSTFPDIRAMDEMVAARDLFRRGDLNQVEVRLKAAAEAIERIADPAKRESTLVYLAEAYAETGQLERCRAVMKRVGRFPLSATDRRLLPGLTRHTAQPSLVGAIAGAGDVPWAVRIAECTVDPHSASQSWWFITRPLMERGDLDAVETIVRGKMCDSADYDPAAWARMLARERLKHRGVHSLPRWVDNLATPGERAWAMIGAAEALCGKSFSEPGF